jgi:hypothetical protein
VNRGQGGIEALQKKNHRKAAKLYAAIDASPIFEARVDPACRSEMNVPFFRPEEERNAEADAAFLKFCDTRNLVTLKGHPDLGGFRASIYNAMTEEGVNELVSAIGHFNDVNYLSGDSIVDSCTVSHITSSAPTPPLLIGNLNRLTKISCSGRACFSSPKFARAKNRRLCCLGSKFVYRLRCLFAHILNWY